ncbi:peptidase T [Carnobacterium maltaromaticum]|jgi:tripeptide aminopeptidase|uniref:Peptidase T n=1 Tax=Carnobacterium maltaromaticum LMA28 TaxID=1234679 RepID=K8E425_CARML|nr:peptidase T [Carnobacterium maltaromaticum]AOA02101.1 peptidase T [Carnobacterium maltaromaticum]KRN64447.1 peptidase T [Carnobacterium maltaromaticum DSM 20342]MCI1820455.1 peptidase T [Carnobacterium maltaromaticum]CCO11187.2 peptidase T [Carnobacterium maltaromaticum LMA28]
MYENLIPRFLRYVKTETRSDATSKTVPSTQSQVEFAQTLKEELADLGMSQVSYNEKNGFVTATLPSNCDKEVPTIGFIAHMDTADFNAVNVNPQFHENYNGEEIILSATENIRLAPNDFPNLKNYIGQTLITTDGTTLLGADDKAGIAEIMTAMEILLKDKTIKHGTIKVAFGPDEEIGIGADLFDVTNFGADFAYTMDGGPVGELEYESFNAAQAEIKIQGKNVHPGTAKNTMVNALKLALKIDAALPQDEVPEKTDGREGFFHLVSMSGEVEEAQMTYIIRDHDHDKFIARKNQLQDIANKINEESGSERVNVTLFDQYYNMKDIIEKDLSIVDLAEKAMINLGIKPIIEPIRGGTDGSKLSFMGLPTPNIFAGGENFHGRYEFVAVESMRKATDVIVEIAKLNVER